MRASPSSVASAERDRSHAIAFSSEVKYLIGNPAWPKVRRIMAITRSTGEDPRSAMREMLVGEGNSLRAAAEWADALELDQHLQPGALAQAGNGFERRSGDVDADVRPGFQPRRRTPPDSSGVPLPAMSTVLMPSPVVTESSLRR